MQPTIISSESYPLSGPFPVRLVPTGHPDADALVVQFKKQPTAPQLDLIFNAGNRWEKDAEGNNHKPDAMIGESDKAYAEVFDTLVEEIEGLIDLQGNEVLKLENVEAKALLPIGTKRASIAALDIWKDKQTDIRLGGCVVRAEITLGGKAYAVEHTLRTPTLEEKREYDKLKKLFRRGREVYAINWFTLASDLYEKVILNVKGYDGPKESVPASHRYNIIGAMFKAGEKYALG